MFSTDTAFAGTDITFLHSFDGTNSAGVLKDGDGNAVTLTGAATTLQLMTEAQYDALKAACPSISRHDGAPEQILEGLGLTNEPWPLASSENKKAGK